MHDTDAQDPGIVDSLRHSQERLQFFIDHAPGAMAMLDREMRYIAVNRDWRMHYAPGGESVLGRSHYDVYPEMKPEWRAAHRRGLAGEVTKTERERVVRPRRLGHLAALGSAALVRGAGHGGRHRPVPRGHQRPGGVGRGCPGRPPEPRRPDWHHRRHRLGGRRRDLPLHLRQRPGRAPARLPGQRLDRRPGLLGGAHPSRRSRGLGPLLRRMHAGRARPPVRLPDARRRRTRGLAAGPGDRARRRRTSGDAARRDGRHHRTQARRGGAARERGALPHARRFGADAGVDERAGSALRLLQPAPPRIHRPRPEPGYPRRLGRRPPSRRAPGGAGPARGAPSRRTRRSRWTIASSAPTASTAGCRRTPCRASTRTAGSPATSAPASTSRSGGGPKRRGSGSRRSCGSRRRWRRWARSPAASPTTSTTCWRRSAATSRWSRWTWGSRHPAQENLGEMRRAVHRATELVQRILTFSRPETHEQQPVQLGPVVLEAVHLLRSLIPAGIELSHHVEPDLPDVLANASQVHQVIVNLVDQRLAGHGRRARPDRRAARRLRRRSGAGRQPRRTAAGPVRLPRRSRTPGTAWRRRRSSASSSRSSPPSRRARAPASACRWCTASPAGTAAPSSSRASCARARRSGCCSRPASDVRRPSRTAGRAARAARRRRAHPLSRRRGAAGQAGRLRSSSGSAIGSAATRASRRRWPRSAPSRTPSISVVTDYNMPAMSGMDVALTVMSLRPSVIVALASGYLRPAEAEHARGLGIRATIRKPYTLEELGEVVQRLLHARHGPRPDAPPRRAGRRCCRGGAYNDGLPCSPRWPSPAIDRCATWSCRSPASTSSPGRTAAANPTSIGRCACSPTSAQGRAIASLAQEGGLTSVLWAGPEEISRDRSSAGEHAGPGDAAQGPDQPEARVRVRRLRLRHRSRAAAAASRRADSFRTIPRSSASASGTARRCGRPRVLVDRRGPFVRARSRRRLAVADAASGDASTA